MTFYQRIFAFSKHRPLLFLFLLGSLVGLVAPILYLVGGGDVFLNVPTWATILYFPGFLIGNLFYNSIGFSGAVTTGIFTLVLCYGLLALGIGLLIVGSRKRHETFVSEESSK